MRAASSEAENEHQQNQAKMRANFLLRTLYRQINLSANVQLLSARSSRSNPTVLTPQRIQKETLNREYAVKALDMVKGIDKFRRKSRKFKNNALFWWPKRPRTRQILRIAQKRLTRAWESLNRDAEVFSICARSMVFRGAASRETPLVWDAFENLLKENFVSILAFAQTRRLDSKAFLPRDDAMLYPIQAGGRRVETLHPHEIVVNLKCQHLRRPSFDNSYQMNIGSYPNYSKLGDADPTIRRPTDGKCDVCSSDKLCDCIYPAFPALFLELIETADGRGTGVRALANFTKDTALGAFMGEVLSKDGADYDPVYSVRLAAKTDFRTVRAMICPKRYGNWTRFVNHSCDPSVVFVPRTIGKRIYVMMETLRDIEAFEEITVDYGQRYWKSKEKQCLCRSRLCKDKDRPMPERKPHPIPTISLDNPYRSWNLRPDGEDKDGVWAMWENFWEEQQDH
ncbi:hypothetical protein GX50_02313 [[Emmonsia] crescens]|uniref:SET domain-containing protein n=1 Tax=[Emmonsia] crescens TaxID=73230 RepID=A0A2B7ZNV7_9EURO|nr:hypothetical protein GX50_02313 [Emmonsia crescens]